MRVAILGIIVLDLIFPEQKQKQQENRLTEKSSRNISPECHSEQFESAFLGMHASLHKSQSGLPASKFQNLGFHVQIIASCSCVCCVNACIHAALQFCVLCACLFFSPSPHVDFACPRQEPPQPMLPTIVQLPKPLFVHSTLLPATRGALLPPQGLTWDLTPCGWT